jgi:uncharacterized protein with HEPN domain
MPFEYDPADCFADILDNIDRIETYVAGLSRAALERDGRTRDAVERCLERICEATFRLGDRAAKLVPGQAWRDLRGMGNRLRHAYHRVSFDVICNAVYEELPGLKRDALAALAALKSEGDG